MTAAGRGTPRYPADDPGPPECRTVGDLVAALRELRVRAGNPSVRELARRVRDDRRRRHGPAAAEVSPTTVWYCFDPARRRLDHDLVFDLLTALGVPESEQGGWRRAWQQATARTGPAAVRVASGPPPVPAGFRGRTAELARIAAAAAAGDPVVVVTGMPGSGKSWLAARAAADLLGTGAYDVALSVPLHGFDPGRPPAVPAEVLDGLLWELTGGGTGGRGGRARSYRAALRDRRVLLLLDDAAGAAQVRPLLATSPGSLTIVTSRRPLAELADPPAARVELTGLDPDGAAALLRDAAGPERARAEPGALADIAELCGRLPLALGIAAGDLQAHPDWPLADHAERLRAVGLPGVAAALSVSYRRLGPDERALFRLLGVHPGPDVTADAAAALAGCPPSDARDRLAVLAAAGLLPEPVPGRYDPHALVRAYAAERGAEEDPASVRRLAFRRLIEQAVRTTDAAVGLLYRHARRRPDRPGAGPPPAVGWPEGTARLTVELAVALQPHLDVVGRNADARGLHRRALRAAGRCGDPAARALAQHHLALAESKLGLVAAAVRGFERALAGWRALGDVEGEVRSLAQLATTESLRGGYRQALRHLRDAAAIADPVDPVLRSYLLCSQGTALVELGEHAAAAAVLTEAAGLSRSAADRYGLAWILNNLGVADRRLGRPAAATRWHEEALALHRQVGDRAGEAFARSNLGVDHRLAGALPEALAHSERATALAAEVGDPGLTARLGNDAAATLRAAGRTQAALATSRSALVAGRRAGDRHEQARAHAGIAAALAGSGRAAAHEARARALYEVLGVPPAPD